MVTTTRDDYSNRDYTKGDYPTFNDIEYQAEMETYLEKNPLARVALKSIMNTTKGDVSKVLQNVDDDDDSKDFWTKIYGVSSPVPGYIGVPSDPDKFQQYSEEEQNINPIMRIKLSSLDSDKQKTVTGHELGHFGLRVLFDEGLIDKKLFDKLQLPDKEKPKVSTEERLMHKLSSRDDSFAGIREEGFSSNNISKTLDSIAEDYLLGIAKEDLGYAKGGDVGEGYATDNYKQFRERNTPVSVKTNTDFINAVPEGLGSLNWGEILEESLPLVGETAAIKRASDAFKEGDYLGTGIEATAGVLGVVPFVGDLAGKSVRSLFNKIKKDKDHIYIVHSGADFTGDFNPSKIGTGEGRFSGAGPKNASRPMGDGLYGYVLDPNDVKEFDRAFTQSAKTYAEKYGGRSHIFKIKKEDVKKQIPYGFKKNKLYGGAQDRNMKYDYAVERVGGDEIGGLTEIRVNPEKAIRVSDPQILTKDGTAFRKSDRYINKPSDTRGPAVDPDKFDALLQKKYPQKVTYEYKGGTGITGGGRPAIFSKNKPANPLEIGINPATKNGALLKKYDISTSKNINKNSSAATAGTKEANKLINAKVADGTKIGVRLNLNSTIPNMPKGLDKLQTLHKNNYNGKALSYKGFATVENVTFNVSQKGRQSIVANIKKLDVPEAKNKYPAMSVDGNYNSTRNVLEEIDDTIVQIGFNPETGHLFVDMSTGQAVKSADVATVIGDRVFAKGVTYMKKADAPEPLNATDGTILSSEVRYKMNKGGDIMPMEQQMEMFAVGGLDDDGLSRDPVSGNEIPPGSMANEVRDDVEARLSDGEYVVPANVVRFFGVKFFEDLRTQAMQGLADMEANGRIGGQPVPADMPMQDQMAQGQPPISEGEMEMLQSMMNKGGYIQGYQTGGTPDFENPSNYPFNPSPFLTVGGSYLSPNNPNVTPDPNLPPTTMPVAPSPSPESGISFVTMVNPATGEIQVVQFMGGDPVDQNLYNSLLDNGYFAQGSRELAAYKQQLNEDNIESDRQMGGDKPKSINDLLSGDLYGDMSLGLGAKALGSVINSVFPTKSNQQVLDFILDPANRDPVTGESRFPPSGPGIRDTTKPLMGNGKHPFKKDKNGFVLRSEGKDGPRSVAKEEVARLLDIMNIKKANTKKGVLDDQAYREALKKAGHAKQVGFSTKFVNPADWHKSAAGIAAIKALTATGTKKSKPSTLTVGSAEDLANRRLNVRDPSGTKFTNYEYDAEGNNLTVKGRKDLLDDVETRYKDVLPDGLGSRLTPDEVDDAIKSSAPTTVDSDFSNDNNNNNNNNNENNTASPSNPNVGNVDTTVDSFENTAGGKFMNKGGLLKKPKKKKTKK